MKHVRPVWKNASSWALGVASACCLLVAAGTTCSAILPFKMPLGVLLFSLETQREVAAADTRLVSPYRGLTYTSEGVAKVRALAQQTARGDMLASEIFASIEPWMALSDNETQSLIPPVDAVFASGLAGDPETGESWPAYAGSDGMCSLSRPGEVKSPYTGIWYGNEPYYDPGDGWVRPSDGKRFYFRGIWNSWAVREMHEAIDDLALAYMLTGDEAVAERGLLMLDELATLKAARGEEPGLIDGSSYGETNKHFFSYSGNLANDRHFQTALSLDLLAGSAAAGNPSRGMPGKTIFENIRDNYFAVYELFYKESRSTLYNHTTALFANQLAQAVLFGRPDELKEGVDLINVWLNQCITRDGQYYENAGGYERVGVDYFSKVLLPLTNYSPENYDSPADFMSVNDVSYGDDPRWYSAALLMKYRMMAIARIICFGDMWEDRLVLPGRTRGEEKLWCTYARLLYTQTSNPEWREAISQGYWRLPAETRDDTSLHAIRSMGMSQWLPPDEPQNPLPVGPAGDFLLEEPSELLPGKMIALMRGGKKAEARAAFMNGSVHYSHGSDAQMELLLYAKGMCLSGIYGYPLAGSPAHRGWTIKPASHCTLVINEDLPAPKYPAKNAPPASLQGWLTEQAGLSVQLVEMSNPYLWHDRIAPDMSEYRRLLWTVDVSDDEFYFLDFFRATGGHTHDYLWTGQWLDTTNSTSGFSVEGVTPESVDGVWSMAGFNSSYKNEYYNQPGLSWGERLIRGKDGSIAFAAAPDEQINVDRYWNPPPGNGYGFIYDVRQEVTTNNWAAKWELIDGRNKMRLTFINNEEQQAISALSPAYTVNRDHTMAIARRSGTEPLKSRFAGLVEVAAPGRWPVVAANRLDIDPAKGMGVSLSLTNGCTDTLLAGENAGTAVSVEGFDFTGARAFVRKAADGSVLEMMLHEGSEIVAGEYALRFSQTAWTGRVTRVSPSSSENEVAVDVQLPKGALLEGQPALFFNAPDATAPLYLQDEAYLIENVSSEGQGSVLHFGTQRLVSSEVVVDSVAADGGVTTTWPNEILGGRYYDTGYFMGRQVLAADDPARATRVQSYPGRKTFYPVNQGLFQPGDHLEFRTVKDGDCFRIPSVGALKWISAGRWSLKANADVSVRLPAAPGDALYLMSSNHPVRMAETEGNWIECTIPVESLDAEGVEILVTPAPVVAEYNFDDSSDLGKDSSGNAYHLSTNPGFQKPEYTVDGSIGGAVSFDGAASWLTPAGIYPQGSFSVTAWVKPADTNITSILGPVVRSGGAGMFHAAGSYRYRVFEADSNFAYRIGAPSVPGEWAHLAMTYDAISGPDADGNYLGTFRVYTDGIVYSEKFCRYAAPSDCQMFLGSIDDLRRYRGLIDQVTVYDGVLSKTAINNLIAK